MDPVLNSEKTNPETAGDKADAASSPATPTGKARGKGAAKAPKSPKPPSAPKNTTGAGAGSADKPTVAKVDAKAPTAADAAKFVGTAEEEVLAFRALEAGRFAVVTRSGQKLIGTPAERAAAAKAAADAKAAKAARK